MNDMHNHPKMKELAVSIGGSLVHWLVAGVLALAISIVVVSVYGYLHRNDAPIIIKTPCP